MDVEDCRGGEPAALREDEVGRYLQGSLVFRALHLGEEGPQAVHQGEGDARKDVHALVVQAKET